MTPLLPFALLACSKTGETDAPTTATPSTAAPTTAAPSTTARPSASARQQTDISEPPKAREQQRISFGPDGLSTTQDGVEVAVLAGGCFWGMEEILREIDGVLDTEVGYAGGTSSSPTYDDVKEGTSGHAESVRVSFDPQVLSFRSLLEDWFFRMHDPTTKDRQGNDRGSQYRSAIFATSKSQEKTAQQVVEEIDRSGAWGARITTEVTAAERFTPAEEVHQDYLQRNPGGYTCHYLRDLTF